MTMNCLIKTTILPQSLLISFSGHSQDEAPKYIFDQPNLEQHAQDLSAIYASMAKYYEAVEIGNVEYLESVFHVDWYMRDTDTPDEAILNVEDKNRFYERVRNRPLPGYAEGREFTTTSLANGHLAFMRINKKSSKSSTSFMFFKINGNWVIMDKVWVNTEEIAHTSEEYQAVEQLLDRYHQASYAADRNTLKELLHEQWDRKWVDSQGSYQRISKDDFLNSLEKEASESPNKLRSIDMYYNKLAIARIDLPAKASTSFLFLFKVNGKWVIAFERLSVGSDLG